MGVVTTRGHWVATGRFRCVAEWQGEPALVGSAAHEPYRATIRRLPADSSRMPTAGRPSGRPASLRWSAGPRLGIRRRRGQCGPLGSAGGAQAERTPRADHPACEKRVGGRIETEQPSSITSFRPQANQDAGRSYPGLSNRSSTVTAAQLLLANFRHPALEPSMEWNKLLAVLALRLGRGGTERHGRRIDRLPPSKGVQNPVIGKEPTQRLRREIWNAGRSTIGNTT